MITELPSPPLKLLADRVQATQLDLRWMPAEDEKLRNVEFYVIKYRQYRPKEASAPYTSVLVATQAIPSNSNIPVARFDAITNIYSYTLSNLQPHTLYHFLLVSKSAYAESMESALLEQTTQMSSIICFLLPFLHLSLYILPFSLRSVLFSDFAAQYQGLP